MAFTTRDRHTQPQLQVDGGTDGKSGTLYGYRIPVSGQQTGDQKGVALIG